jgi:hypothetical protein
VGHGQQVARKLSEGNKQLSAERAQLLHQFDKGNSLFAKAERRELKQLQGKNTPHQLQAAHVKDSWHL